MVALRAAGPGVVTSDADTVPFVSVIMPVRDEAPYILRSLESVLAQEYPADRLEVIVSDGRSTDGTRDIVELVRRGCERVHLIDNPGRTAPAGLNAAVRAAQGDILIRVDGHCEIPPQYVSRCVSHLKTDGVDAVGGAVTTVGESHLAKAIALAMSSWFGVGGSKFRTVRGETLFVDTVAFPAYPRDVLERAGPFDEELVRNQDDEYNYRLRKAGSKILLAADVSSRYYSRSSLKSLFRQHFQYGYWKVRVLQKHPKQMIGRQFVPPLFVASLIFAALLAPITHWGGDLLLFIVGSYLVASLVGSVLAVQSEGIGLLPLLPMVFAVIHFAYGSGFLVGLAHFRNRWRETSPAPEASRDP